MNTMILEKQKIAKYPYLKKIEYIQKAYDFLEDIEDMAFVQHDIQKPDIKYVDRKVFKKIISKK